MPDIFDRKGTIQVTGLSALEKKLKELDAEISDKIVEAALTDGAEIMRADAEAICPKKTGKLAASIKVKTEKALGYLFVLVVSNNPLAHIVEFGTAPHVIVPKKKKFLHFGKTITKEVSHPGTAARPFMRPAFDNDKEKSVRKISESMWKGIERFLKR